MLPPVEVVAMALVIGLYLQDTLLLLYDNEAVLEQGGARGYRIRFGARSFQLARRNPFLPNPLTPWRAVFRLAWQPQPRTQAHACPDGRTATSVQAALRVPSWGLAPIAAGLFVGLPLCLYFDAGWAPFLSLVGSMYAAAGFVLVWLWRQRARLTLGKGPLALLTFESLVCLPCALNVLRKATSRVHIVGDLLEVARPLVSEMELRRATDRIVARLDERIEAADAGSLEWQRLTEYRARLSAGPV